MLAINFYSTYSILSGFGNYGDWVETLKESGYDFIAAADKLTQAGLIEFQEACKKAEIPFALGEEFNVYESLGRDPENLPSYQGCIALYAVDMEGYKNLIKINNFSQRREEGQGGFYYKPRIDLNTILRFSKGLVCVLPGVDAYPFHTFGDLIATRYGESDTLDVLKGAFKDRLFLGVNPQIEKVDLIETRSEVAAAEARIREMKGESAQEAFAALAPKQKLVEYMERVLKLNKMILGDEEAQVVLTRNAHYPHLEYAHLYDVMRRIDHCGSNMKTMDREVLFGFMPPAEDQKILEDLSCWEMDRVRQGEAAFKDLFRDEFQIPTGTYYMPPVEVRKGSVSEDLFASILEHWKERVCPETIEDELYSLEDLYAYSDYVSYECTQRGETGGHRLYNDFYDEAMERPEIIKSQRIFPLVDYVDRLIEEWSLIKELEFESYFHVLRFIYDYAREIDGTWGPCRGSGGGSLLAYLLGLSKVDPLRHGLLFERFLSRGRTDLPDYDMDFSSSTREAILDMLRTRNGADKVVNIGTYARYKIKSAIKAIAEANGWAIPNDRGGNTIYSRYAMDNLFRDLNVHQDVRGEDELEELMEFDAFERFYDKHSEWFYSHVLPLQDAIYNDGIHPAGVVILPEHHDECLPIRYVADRVVGQFKDRYTELRGFPKFDFLVIDAADILECVRDMVRKRHGQEIPDERLIPFDDRGARSIFWHVYTEGIFQFKTFSQRRHLKMLRPTLFEHLVASVALIRPGPIAARAPERYCAYVNGHMDPTFLHPDLEDIMGETYGLLIYQETIMEISKKLAGFSGAEADALRKAVGKKDKKKMEAVGAKFVGNLLERGYDEEFVSTLWDEIRAFGAYGFNLSHSVAYTMISFTQAYIQSRYPEEYWSAVMRFAKHDAKKSNNLYTARIEAESQGIEFIFPTIHGFKADFEPAGKGQIYWPLIGLKGIRAAAVQMCEAGDSFDSIEDFVKAVYGGKVNVGHLDTLVSAGFFDPICPAPEAAVRVREAVYEVSRKKAHLRIKATHSHSDGFKWARMKNEAYNHTVDKWKEVAPFSEEVVAYPGDALADVEDGSRITVGGIVEYMSTPTTKNGDKYCKLTLSDRGEEIRIKLWSDFWLNPVLDLEHRRPRKGEVVEICGVKDSFTFEDTGRTFHQISLNGAPGDDCRVVWREKNLADHLFDD